MSANRQLPADAVVTVSVSLQAVALQDQFVVRLIGW